MKTKVIIKAGNLYKEALMPTLHRSDTSQVRAEKKRVTCEAQQRMNAVYSWQKLELMLAANIVPGDCVCVLTYTDEKLPAKRSKVVDDFKAFRRKYAALRQKQNKPAPVMIWCIERSHADGVHEGGNRWHIHLCINSTGADIKDLRIAWNRGAVLMDRFRLDRDHSYESLARYMCKEPREKVGLRSWSYTRSCKHPEIDKFKVPDDTPLQVPHGCQKLNESADASPAASYKYIKYLAPASTSARPRARRR